MPGSSPESNIPDLNFFLETDNTPFLLYNRLGEIVYLNRAAEIVLGHVEKSELYRLALLYAPSDFGSRTTAMELQYRHLNFYAVSVAYRDEEYIGIRLYYRPQTRSTMVLDSSRLTMTNIHIILEAAITLFSLESATRLDLLTDAALPEFKLDQNTFSRLLRKSLHLFRASTHLHISLSMAIGESMVIRRQRYPIVRLVLEADTRDSNEERDIKTLAEEMGIAPLFESGRILFDIPFVQ